MKFTFLILAALFTTEMAQAQYASRSTPSSFSSRYVSQSCECTQFRIKTGQDFVVGGERDGTASVCLFQPFGFGNKTSFDGGWFRTSDIVGHECSGGVAGSGRTTYGPQPSPLCRITSVRETIPAPGRCVHQADLNRSNSLDAEERAAWEVKNTPITQGPAGYVGKAAQIAIDEWDLSFSMLISGSKLCDSSLEKTEPYKYAECLALPVECRRLLFVNATNPRSAQQIVNAYSGYNNSLNHCVLPDRM